MLKSERVVQVEGGSQDLVTDATNAVENVNDDPVRRKERSLEYHTAGEVQNDACEERGVLWCRGRDTSPRAE